MHFVNLTSMGDHYTAEEGTEGVRRQFLNGVAAQYVQKRMDLEVAQAATVKKIGTGSVRDRASFFATGAGGKDKAVAEAEVKRLQGIIDKLLAKLQRQGAVLRPDGTIDWAQTTRTVTYDTTAAQQGLTRLRYGNGFLFSDDARTRKFDTADMVTAFGGRGWAIYVMSDTGNIHASPHSVGHRHHSSLLAGATVAGAGEMRVLGGKLMQISNKSGHYAPAAAHFVQVLYVLQKRGVDLGQTKVMFKSAVAQEEFPSVAAFMAALSARAIDADYEYTKMMGYLNRINYAAFAPLAHAKGWRWGTPADFAPGGPASGGRGVVTTAGVQVPHREVRKWLKGLGHVLNPDIQSGAGR